MLLASNPHRSNSMGQESLWDCGTILGPPQWFKYLKWGIGNWKPSFPTSISPCGWILTINIRNWPSWFYSHHIPIVPLNHQFIDDCSIINHPSLGIPIEKFIPYLTMVITTINHSEIVVINYLNAILGAPHSMFFLGGELNASYIPTSLDMIS